MTLALMTCASLMMTAMTGYNRFSLGQRLNLDPMLAKGASPIAPYRTSLCE